MFTECKVSTVCRFDTKNTLVSGNAGDKENLFPGRPQIYFFN